MTMKPWLFHTHLSLDLSQKDFSWGFRFFVKETTPYLNKTSTFFFVLTHIFFLLWADIDLQILIASINWYRPNNVVLKLEAIDINQFVGPSIDLYQVTSPTHDLVE